jgi:hypothetical protein
LENDKFAPSHLVIEDWDLVGWRNWRRLAPKGPSLPATTQDLLAAD